MDEYYENVKNNKVFRDHSTKGMDLTNKKYEMLNSKTVQDKMI